MTLADTALAIARENGVAMMDLLGVVKESLPVIHPGLDYVGGHLYVTFPTERLTTRKVGRGKDAREKNVVELITLSVRDDGLVNNYDEETMNEAGYGWPAVFQQQRSSRWPVQDIRKFATATTRTAVDTKALYDEIRTIYWDHVEFREELHYDIVTIYLMMSYVFTVFESQPYLHFNGLKGSGKSQNISILNALAFNTIWASNMSVSAMFRQIAGCPGLLAIDEAEDFTSDTGKELKLILQSGYKRGSTVFRSVGEDFVPTTFDVYSPKVLASINPLEAVLADRCLIIPMEQAVRKVPTFRVNDKRWPALRSKLYAWAMVNASAIAELADEWMDRPTSIDSQLANREWELSGPILAMAHFINGPDHVTTLLPFIEAMFASKISAQSDADRRVILLRTLPSVMHAGAVEDSWYKVSSIHEAVLEYLDKDQHDYYKTKTARANLASLGFKTFRQKRGGPQVWLEEPTLREKFQRNRIEPLPEDLAWSRGEESYAHVIPPDRPPAIALWDEPDTEVADEFGFLEEIN